MTITVSTDGSALGNPNGPMGWAWADHTPHAGGQPGHEHPGDCDAGGATNGTNQIGELCAVLEALRAHPGSEPLVIETDSQYAISCSTKWVHGWKRNGWKNSQKKPVKNAALIKAIDAELSKRAGSVKFVWVKGHAGNAGNEKVDELARTYAADCRSKARDGYLPKEGWQSLMSSEYADGLDVPGDAQMLLDGAISDADYHLGRGSQDDDGESRHATNHDRRPSLAEMLTEPEGVPDYPFAENTDDTINTVTTDTATTDSSPDTDEATAAAARTTDDASRTTNESPRAAGHGATPAPSSTPTSDGTTARRSRSGLTVSGTLRFSPPPASSPTYNGSPRFIRGVIEVEGYVQGDGTLTLDGAVFQVRRG
ncbi:MAG: ribonuclease HI [Bifidobacterium sp.]|uniref:ribonuclease H family protein n=1 Tax=Bifidobacterium TaxID=1678 RepID=UPI0024ACE0F1|nr:MULTISPECIES: ribonuclease H [Bifidobacterium]MBS5400590.1 ribonuclease HI [Bifidobacterium sp.]